MKFAKHIFVLHHLASIPRPEYEEKVGSSGDPYKLRVKNVTSEQAEAAWDFLFEYIHANWTPPAMMTGDIWQQPRTDEQKVEVYDCRQLLSYTTMEELEERLASLPPYYSEAIFPIAVGRYLLRNLALPINHRALKTFKEFHERYGSTILSW